MGTNFNFLNNDCVSLTSAIKQQSRQIHLISINLHQWNFQGFSVRSWKSIQVIFVGFKVLGLIELQNAVRCSMQDSDHLCMLHFLK